MLSLPPAMADAYSEFMALVQETFFAAPPGRPAQPRPEFPEQNLEVPVPNPSETVERAEHLQEPMPNPGEEEAWNLPEQDSDADMAVIDLSSVVDEADQVAESLEGVVLGVTTDPYMLEPGASEVPRSAWSKRGGKNRDYYAWRYGSWHTTSRWQGKGKQGKHFVKGKDKQGKGKGLGKGKGFVKGKDKQGTGKGCFKGKDKWGSSASSSGHWGH